MGSVGASVEVGLSPFLRTLGAAVVALAGTVVDDMVKHTDPVRPVWDRLEEMR